MTIKSILNKKHSSKIISGIITIFILGVLIASGPANAFELGISVDAGENHNFEKGNNVKLTATFNINNNDANLPIDELSLFIDGPGANDYACLFNVDGSEISGCDDITIELIESEVNYGYGYSYGYNNNNYYNFGYGYGYGNGSGSLTYKITIDTDDYHLGSYKASFLALIGNNTFESDSSHFVVSQTNSDEDDEDDDEDDNNNGGCATTWTCSEWTSCIDGKQIRSCNKGRLYCYADVKDKPIEERTCVVETQTATTNIIELGDEDSETETQETQTSNNNANTARGRLSRITGAVIGAEGMLNAWIVIIVFIIGIVGLSLAISIIRKRRMRFRY